MLSFKEFLEEAKQNLGNKAEVRTRVDARKEGMSKGHLVLRQKGGNTPGKDVQVHVPETGDTHNIEVKNTPNRGDYGQIPLSYKDGKWAVPESHHMKDHPHVKATLKAINAKDDWKKYGEDRTSELPKEHNEMDAKSDAIGAYYGHHNTHYVHIDSRSNTDNTHLGFYRLGDHDPGKTGAPILGRDGNGTPTIRAYVKNKGTTEKPRRYPTLTLKLKDTAKMEPSHLSLTPGRHQAA